ncbi:hypothetical protein V9T40_005848 [Parthenolecanium corni]|uniref:Uncharacterized protein n=1 Tax=Parthenolecanium corni TaxID=536013 RepID=A0AAN9TVR7_9HEMI
MAFTGPPGIPGCMNCAAHQKEVNDMTLMVQASISEQRRLKEMRDACASKLHKANMEIVRIQELIADMDRAHQTCTQQSYQQPSPPEQNQPLNLTGGHTPDSRRMSVDTSTMEQRVDTLIANQRFAEEQFRSKRPPSPVDHRSNQPPPPTQASSFHSNPNVVRPDRPMVRFTIHNSRSSSSTQAAQTTIPIQHQPWENLVVQYRLSHGQPAVTPVQPAPQQQLERRAPTDNVTNTSQAAHLQQLNQQQPATTSDNLQQQTGLFQAIMAYCFQTGSADQTTPRARHPSRHIPMSQGTSRLDCEPIRNIRHRALELADQEWQVMIREGRRVASDYNHATMMDKLRYPRIIVQYNLVGHPLGIHLTISNIKVDRRFCCWIDTCPQTISMGTYDLFHANESLQHFANLPFAHYPYLDSNEELASDDASINLRIVRELGEIVIPISLTRSWNKDWIIIALDDIKSFITNVDLYHQTLTLRYSAEVEWEQEYFFAEQRLLNSHDPARQDVGRALQSRNNNCHLRNVIRWKQQAPQG